MQKQLIIDLDNWKKSNLYLVDYTILQMLYEGIKFEEYNIFENEADIVGVYKSLEKELYIKILDEEIEPRQKLIDLFEKAGDKIDFDEVWNVFPIQTPNGRSLRSANKEFSGKLTSNYITCKKKYLSKVKKQEIHEQIITIIKARVNSGDYEFINNMETYINKEAWQIDIKYLTLNKVSTNRMI